MAAVNFDNTEIYFDTRFTAEWNAVTKVIPKGYICVELTDDGKCKMKIGDSVNAYSALPYVGGDIDATQIDTAIAAALANYYTKTQTDDAISNAISELGTLFTFRGRVDDTSALPSSDNVQGYVYLVGAEDATEFAEYYWTGTMWDYMGTTTAVDLSDYYTKAQTDTLFNDLEERVAAIEGEYVKSTDKLILNCSLE